MEPLRYILHIEIHLSNNFIYFFNVFRVYYVYLEGWDRRSI